jgi:hypothetical protein
MYTLGLALLTLPYWILFTTDLFLDLHLTYVTLGMVLKMLLPVALLCNVVADIIGIVSLMKKSPWKKLTLVGLILNTLPLLGIGWMFFWWTFIFKM